MRINGIFKLLALFLLSFGAQSQEAKVPNHSPNFDNLGMEISEEEGQAIIKSMQYGREISKAAEKINGLPYRRDAHAKATGCVRALFSIKGDIPAHYRHSIFQQAGKTYPAWIRFSNGDMTVQADSKPDARGMAIKVMGVDGEKIAPELPGDGTQDFIMTNTPAFFNRNIFDYVDDMYYLSKLQRTRWFISFFPPKLHPKLLYRATQTVSAKITNPLEPQYYSMLPYQVGHTQVKFSVKPCTGMRFNSKVDKTSEDYLTDSMQNHLQSRSACFDFGVQEKIAGADMPLDDASVIWSETVSPFVNIARIHIPRQTFTSEAQMTFCENLSMNPWHAVGEWQPLGSLNKARRLVYYAVSQYRHQQNKEDIREPGNWCLGNANCKQPIHSVNEPEEIKLYFDTRYQALVSDSQARPYTVN